MDPTESSPISLDVFGGASTPPTSIPPSPTSANFCAKCGGSVTFPSILQSHGLDPQSEEVSLVNEALKGKRSRAPYTEVSVLLLRWDVQHQEWDNEVADLQKIFKEFNFAIFQDHKIGLTKYAKHEVMSLVSNFMIKCGGPESLLIVYYTGHGGVGSDGGCLWGVENEDGVWFTLNWSRIQPRLFEEYEGDVLLLLDCCHAGAAAKLKRPDTKEVLAACREKNTTYGEGDFTFTKKLVQQLRALREAYGTSGFSIHELKCRLIDKLPTEPIHVRVLGNHPIYLRPLVQGTGPEGPSMQQFRGGIEPTGLLKAYVSFKFTGGISTIKPILLRWFGDEAPSDISEITLEGLYSSTSSLAFLSLPIRLWALLPDHEAISFIGLIRSNNMAPNLKKMAVASNEELEHLIQNMPLDPRDMLRRKDALEAWNRPNLPSEYSLENAVFIERTPERPNLPSEYSRGNAALGERAPVRHGLATPRITPTNSVTFWVPRG